MVYSTQKNGDFGDGLWHWVQIFDYMDVVGRCWKMLEDVGRTTFPAQFHSFWAVYHGLAPWNNMKQHQDGQDRRQVTQAAKHRGSDIQSTIFLRAMYPRWMMMDQLGKKDQRRINVSWGQPKHLWTAKMACSKWQLQHAARATLSASPQLRHAVGF